LAVTEFFFFEEKISVDKFTIRIVSQFAANLNFQIKPNTETENCQLIFIYNNRVSVLFLEIVFRKDLLYYLYREYRYLDFPDLLDIIRLYI